KIATDNCNFDIKALGQQIQNECVYPSGFNNSDKFGGEDRGSLGHCITRISRIETIISDRWYNKVINFNNEGRVDKDIIGQVDEFIEESKSEKFDNKNLLYIDVSNVPFSHRMREIVVEVIGQLLLDYSRKEVFKARPMTVFIDEA